MKKIVHTKNAPQAIGPYSQAVESNGFLFVSGQLPIDHKTGNMPDDIKEQTRISLQNTKAIVEEAGLTLDNVIKVTVLLSDIGDFAAMNDVYATFFTKEFPARAAYEVANLPKGAKVEIESIVSK